MTNRLHERYGAEVIPALQKQFGYGNPNEVPKVQQGGIIDVAQPMAISKVMLVCPKCGQPTRVRHTVLDDGRHIRVCSHCGQAMEVTK